MPEQTPPFSTPIEIFRTGTHTAMSGEAFGFSAGDLQAIAASYDPALHEAPICVGHPQHDLPAYGWIKGLSVQGERLSADPSQIDPAFAELLKAGRFKKVSAAFYRPDDAANPKPGSYYLRHVAMLGAQPPAVKGLRQAEFADDTAKVLVFGEIDDGLFVRLFRNLRELVLEKFGPDEAEQVVPRDTLDMMGDQAARPAPSPDTLDDGATMTAFAEREQQLAEERRQLDADKAAHAAQKAADQAAVTAARRAGDLTFAEGLVREGKLLPAQKGEVCAVLDALHVKGAVEFAEGGATVTKSAAEIVKGLLAKLPKQPVFGEFARSEELQPSRPLAHLPAGHAADPEKGDQVAKALQYQETHPGVTFVQACKAVGVR